MNQQGHIQFSTNTHQIPFGEDWVDQRNSSWNAPYTFSGKEKDAETGYGYFGARYYDSGLSIWLSVDPMSDKYPSMSPYNYCANNPVMLVDPDGRTIMVGNTIYMPGPCPDNIQDPGDIIIWNTLNSINSSRLGEMLITELTKKDGYDVIINFGQTTKEHANGEYSAKCEGFGVITLDKDKIENTKSSLLSTLAHELFHGYQHKNKQQGQSLNNELEARLFTYGIDGDYRGLEPVHGSLYEKSIYGSAFYTVLTSPTFDQTAYNTVLNGLKTYSAFANIDDYSTYVLKADNQNNSLIAKFYPIKH